MVVPPSSAEPVPPPPAPDDERAGGAPETRAESKPTLIVIEPVEAEEVRAPSLAEAAARERARRRDGDGPVLVVTNENLAQHAAGGVLTIAHSTSEEEAELEAAAQETAQRETYWRERGLEIRQRWREAVERVPALEAKGAELRQQFYSTDDPAIRDGQIKPEWDKAIADLEQARYQAARGGEEVAAFLDEGRRAGALPGWLREGAELEPEPVVEEVDGFTDHEPVEPSIYEPPPGG
ncbi:MAG TPA: hypothetical protein VMT16_06340 [Thermoanaerobaculia bacterium]|nr:hypothetical protein [Thermoanaerobaculia bacterium]